MVANQPHQPAPRGEDRLLTQAEVSECEADGERLYRNLLPTRTLLEKQDAKTARILASTTPTVAAVEALREAMRRLEKADPTDQDYFKRDTYKLLNALTTPAPAPHVDPAGFATTSPREDHVYTQGWLRGYDAGWEAHAAAQPEKGA